MNKHKTIKMILCLCLALVMLFSPVMDTAAHAVAIESWVIYAIITYLASVGIVFTAAGGAEAVYDAVEKKVQDYGDNVIDFYDIVRGNIKLVPPPVRPPNWNPELGNLLFNAAACEALTHFIEWLTSDGGWAAGTEIIEGYDFATFDAQIYDGSTLGEAFTFATTLVGEWEIANPTYYKRAPVTLEGTSIKLQNNESLRISNGDSFTKVYYNEPYTQYEAEDYANGSYRGEDIVGLGPYIRKFSLGITVDEMANNSQIAAVVRDGYIFAGFIYDGYFYQIGAALHANFIESTLSANIQIPTEIPEIKPLPSVEALILESEFLAADSLESFGDVVENLFIETGTIPQPTPQIIPDPDYQPAPTPVPTPNPSPEYEDVESLGLPALGDALMDKFPFCLPEDLGRLLNIFTAERQTPKWEVDLYEPLHGKIPMQGDTMLTIDLGEYEEIGQITRWASVIGFCLFLLVVTKEFITW